MTARSEETLPAGAGETATPQFARVLLKLSGESLMGDREYGVDPRTVTEIAREVLECTPAARSSRSSLAAETSIAA